MLLSQHYYNFSENSLKEITLKKNLEENNTCKTKMDLLDFALLASPVSHSLHHNTTIFKIKDKSFVHVLG